MKINKIKVMKVMFTLIMALAAITSLLNVVNANDAFAPINADISGGAAKSVQSISGQILGIVQVVGMAVATVMLVVLAIKYISSSPEGKGEIKKTAGVYIVGAVLLFAASGILQVIKGFADEVNKAGK